MNWRGLAHVPWRSRLAAAALLLAGVAALLAMGPQFALFIPVLLAAWLLARFGLLPRAARPQGASVRISGGPSLGSGSVNVGPRDLRFAELRIHVGASDAGAAAALVLELSRLISRHAGTEARIGGDAQEELVLLETTPERVLDARGLTLVWPSGSRPTDGEAERAAGPETQAWRSAWPGLVAARRAHGATVALEARRQDGAARVEIGLLGERAALGAALTDLARDCRESRDIDAWTSGWLRDVERERARDEARRRRRASR